MALRPRRLALHVAKGQTSAELKQDVLGRRDTSLFGSCKANDINPYELLKETLERIPEMKITDLEKLLPVRKVQLVGGIPSINPINIVYHY